MNEFVSLCDPYIFNTKLGSNIFCIIGVLDLQNVFFFFLQTCNDMIERSSCSSLMLQVWSKMCILFACMTICPKNQGLKMC